MRQLESLIKEGLHLAEVLFGFKKTYLDIMKEINSLPNNLTTSLQRDINDKPYIKSELKNQIGAIYKLGVKNKIFLETTNKIYKLLNKKCQKKY